MSLDRLYMTNEELTEKRNKAAKKKTKGLKYKEYFNRSGLFLPVPSGTDSRLPAGVYRILPPSPENPIVQFSAIDDFEMDKILELPSPSFTEVVRHIDTFLLEETKAKYKKFGDFTYKKSMVLYGKPGTGKSVLVARTANLVVERGGVVLYDPHPSALAEAFRVLNDIQPDILTMVVFEEFDRIAKDHEETLLTLLDGGVQKNNIIYMATTNYLKRLSARMIRPGRFGTLVSCGYPTEAEREFYFQQTLVESSPSEIREFATKSKGLSIDDLKDVVLSTQVYSEPLEATIALLKARKD